jgi:hypothetical protein
MSLIPDFLNHYQKPILNQWGKSVLIPKYELLFKNGTLTQKSHISNKIIDFYPLKAMENANPKDIGYELHICNATEKVGGGYNRNIIRTIKKLMVNKIGTNGCYLEGFESNQQTEVKIFDTGNDKLFLKIINADTVVIYLEDDNQLKDISSLLNIELNTDFNSVSIYDMIKQKSVNHNAYFCNNCDNLEYGYGLIGNDGEGGKCIHCQEKVSKHENIKTLIFSMEILKELLKYYDEYSANSSSEKQLLIYEISKFIQKPFDENRSINEMQVLKIKTILKNINTLVGGRNGEPVFSLQHGKFGFAKDENTFRSTTSFRHSIAIVLTCLMYIHKF